jgi:hypothetical protein
MKSTDHVSASGRNGTTNPRKVTTTRENPDLPQPQEKIMVNTQRPGESPESQGQDVEGHRVLRASADEEADVEGHRVLRATPDEDDEDTEGHRVLRVNADGESDVEGHRVLRVDPDEEPDTEGHRVFR